MFEARNQFIGQYFKVEGYDSLYLCSAVDLDEEQNVMSITFFNRFRQSDIEPQSLTFSGDAVYRKIVDLSVLDSYV